ncbi:cation:proton antiporter [Natronorarus salvus]|uniref:cation:proton antiporter n=1 Tax=Natronorarus salvus TaxID=3117733 RepID=UPI002F261EE9
MALLDVGVMFAAIAVVGFVAKRLDQSVIPFYILAGMLLGPFVLGRIELPTAIELGEATLGPTLPSITEGEFIVIGAELGIVLLLFFLGLEFNLERLLAAKDRIGKVGTLDFVVNFGVGLALGFAIFRSLLPAFLVAGIVYISSSAIITKTLIDLEWIANDEAEPMLGTLVYEDLVIAVYLAVASALVLGGDDLADAAGGIGVAMAFILGLLVLVAYGTSFFERVLQTNSNEMIVLRAIGVTVLISGAALALGVSEAVAAFFVGMAFSPTEYVDDLEHLLEPLRDTFAAVFFFWIGLVTDPALFPAVAGLIAVAVVLTTPTKLVTGFLSGKVYGLNDRRSVRVGLGMTTRGEFSLIIAAIAASGAGLALTEATAGTIYAFAVGYVLVMSVLGTTFMRYSGAFERRVLSLRGSDEVGTTTDQHRSP